MPKRNEIEAAIGLDPLANAELLTGKSYKTDPHTMGLGMMMRLEQSAVARKLLEEADDTLFSNELNRYLRIIGEEGFEQILKIDFTSEGKKEHFFVFYHSEDGILLVFDTYGGDHVNGGNFYYNIRPHARNNTFYECISSGGFKGTGGDLVWVGHHDCREALRLHIAKLREAGDFVKEWVESPFLWLLYYGDIKNKGYDYKAINAERIAMFPKEVQQAIAGKQ